MPSAVAPEGQGRVPRVSRHGFPGPPGAPFGRNGGGVPKTGQNGPGVRGVWVCAGTRRARLAMWFIRVIK